MRFGAPPPRMAGFPSGLIGSRRPRVSRNLIGAADFGLAGATQSEKLDSVRTRFDHAPEKMCYLRSSLPSFASLGDTPPSARCACESVRTMHVQTTRSLTGLPRELN